MRIAILDITSRNANQYNPSLCKALVKDENDVTLLSPTLMSGDYTFSYFKLLKLVPKSWVSKVTMTKRLLRVVEVLINYMLVWLYLTFNRVDVLHIQWLPFLEFSSIEKFILKFYVITCYRTKIFLTVHNVYPHGFTNTLKQKYCNRFKELDNCIAGYFVHLESCKSELVNDFGIDPQKINVAYHGIYQSSDHKELYAPKDDKLRIIMYGYQDLYKGADILVESLKLMPSDYINKIDVKIMGKTRRELMELAKSDLSYLNISWYPTFVSDEFLYKSISEANLILLPYRAISQSGVLLLALSFKKPIATSNLPSFIETLKGYEDDWFFESNNTTSLANLIKRYVDHEINIEQQLQVIEKLNHIYSWDETAKSTIVAYKQSIEKN